MADRQYGLPSQLECKHCGEVGNILAVAESWWEIAFHNGRPTCGRVRKTLKGLVNA